MRVNAKLVGRGLAAVLAVSPVLAWGGEPGAVPPGAPPPPPGMRVEAIHDRGMNLDAYFVAIPADWHFQGAVAYGNPCGQAPFAVFRTSSPDGLTLLEKLPRFNWSWGTLGWHPQNQKTQPGCLPLSREMSASEFVQRLAEMLQVEYVEELPVPAGMVEGLNRETEHWNQMGADYARTHASNTTQHGEIAQARVRYQNGTFPMEALLRARLICTRNTVLIQGRNFWSDNCGANVRVVRAPKGKLEDAVKKLEPAGAVENPRWSEAYTQMVTRTVQAGIQQSQQAMAQMQSQNQQFEQSQALRQQQHEQFQQSQTMQQHLHEQFLSTMQRGTDMSMQRAAQSANAQHTAASDMVDYALGQQTVRDPNSGQLYKASATHSYIWVDDSGKKSYQTSDPNANPNGVLSGAWTQQQQVHGDGTSK